jgi:hypothetical protein
MNCEDLRISRLGRRLGVVLILWLGLFSCFGDVPPAHLGC